LSKEIERFQAIRPSRIHHHEQTVECVLAADHYAAMAEVEAALSTEHSARMQYVVDYKLLQERAESAEQEIELLKAERDKYGWAPVQSHEGWKQRADLAENDARLTKLERDKAETALAEARREWANDTEALNALRAEIERLAAKAEEAALSSIEARNPGIDIERVRRERASRASADGVVTDLTPHEMMELRSELRTRGQ